MLRLILVFSVFACIFPRASAGFFFHRSLLCHPTQKPQHRAGRSRREKDPSSCGRQCGDHRHQVTFSVMKGQREMNYTKRSKARRSSAYSGSAPVVVRYMTDESRSSSSAEPSQGGLSPPPPPQASSSSEVSLLQRSSNNNKRPTGVYVRPSAAIERGSGFFVPGLEGPKVRYVVGTVLLLLAFINNSLSSLGDPSSTTNNLSPPISIGISQGLAVMYSLIVLLQGAIESLKLQQQQQQSSLMSSSSPSSASSLLRSSDTSYYSNSTSSSSNTILDSDHLDRALWVASTYLSLTRATHMWLIENSQIVYTLQKKSSPLVTDGMDSRSSTKQLSPVSPDNLIEACKAALATLLQSNSGRVALPVKTHPTALTLQRLITKQDNIDDNSNSDRSLRTVLLQRINDKSCWAVGSYDLLAGFSSQDLTMLGRMAQYMNEIKS